MEARYAHSIRHDAGLHPRIRHDAGLPPQSPHIVAHTIRFASLPLANAGSAVTPTPPPIAFVTIIICGAVRMRFLFECIYLLCQRSDLTLLWAYLSPSRRAASVSTSCPQPRLDLRLISAPQWSITMKY